MLDSLQAGDSGENQAERLLQWQDWVVQILTELHGFHQAIASISRRYFDGHSVLFPDAAEQLEECVYHAEEVVKTFNDEFAGEGGPVGKIDRDVVGPDIDQDAARQQALLVDLARADTLVAAGERQAAAGLMERYL